MVATDYSNAIDENDSTTLVLEAEKKFYLKLGTIPELGKIKRAYANLIIEVSAVSGSAPYGTIRYYNADHGGAVKFSTGQSINGTGKQTYVFNSDDTAHGTAADESDEGLIWTWSEIGAYEWGITVGAGDTITISDIYLVIQDM